MSLLMIVVIIT